MSGGVAGYGAGSAQDRVEVDTAFDNAREQVAGLRRKRDRLKREHEAAEAEVGTAESITLKRKRDRCERAHEVAEAELVAAEAILGVLEAAEKAEGSGCTCEEGRGEVTKKGSGCTCASPVFLPPHLSLVLILSSPSYW